MNILNFGSLNIDCVYSVEHFVRAGAEVTNGKTPAEALKLSSAASITVSRKGAAPSIPTRDEVLSSGKL